MGKSTALAHLTLTESESPSVGTLARSSHPAPCALTSSTLERTLSTLDCVPGRSGSACRTIDKLTWWVCGTNAGGQVDSAGATDGDGVGGGRLRVHHAHLHPGIISQLLATFISQRLVTDHTLFREQHLLRLVVVRVQPLPSAVQRKMEVLPHIIYYLIFFLPCRNYVNI